MTLASPPRKKHKANGKKSANNKRKHKKKDKRKDKNKDKRKDKKKDKRKDKKKSTKKHNNKTDNNKTSAVIEEIETEDEDRAGEAQKLGVPFLKRKPKPSRISEGHWYPEAAQRHNRIKTKVRDLAGWVCVCVCLIFFFFVFIFQFSCLTFVCGVQ